MRGSALSRLFVAAALCAFAQSLDAQRADTGVARRLGPGVTYRKLVDQRGPWVVSLLRVDLRRAEIALRHARARD